MKLPDLCIGDYVIIRDWDDMVSEFGIIGSVIQCRFGFSIIMQSICGLKCRVESINRLTHKITTNDPRINLFAISSDMLRLDPDYPCFEDDFNSILFGAP